MNQNGMDGWVRRLSAGVPRRQALGALVAGALGLSLGAQDGLGKKKKHKKAPKLASAYTCAGNPDFSVGTDGNVRLGQLFTATRSGTLRQIRVGVIKEDLGSGGDYLVQLLRTTGDPAVPGTGALDVLAAAVIRDGDVPLGTSTVVANFAATHLVQDTVYAVVVARPGASNYSVQTYPDDDDVCAGEMKEIPPGSTLPNDMIVSVLVA